MELKQIAYLADTLVLNKTTTRRLAHDAAKEVCRNTRGPIASIFYQGLDRSDEGLWDFHFVITDNHGAEVPYKFKVRVVDNPRQSSYVFSVYFFILPAIAAGYLLLK